MAAAALDSDYATDPVPDDKRIAWPLVFFAEMGVATALFFMQISSIVALRYGSRVAIIAIVYASIASSLVGFRICKVSATTGYGMNLLARRALGYRGAMLFSLIFGVNSVIYFGAEASIMGASLKPILPGVSLSVVLPAIALGMVPLVWFGMRVLARLQLMTFVLYAILLAAALAVSLGGSADKFAWLHYMPVKSPPFAAALVGAIGTMNSVVFTSALVTADYARFVRRSEMRAANLWVGIGFQAFCYGFSGMLGLWFSTRYHDTNPGAYFVTMIAGWGTLFAIATQLRINLSNMYSGSIAFLNLLRQVANLVVSRHLMVLLFGLVAAAALLFDLLSNLTVALGVIGMFVTCFACLVLVDCYVLHPEWSQHHQDGWCWPAVTSLVAATCLGCLLQTGMLGRTWSDLASLVAALVQSVLYIVITKRHSAARRPVRFEAQG